MAVVQASTFDILTITNDTCSPIHELQRRQWRLVCKQRSYSSNEVTTSQRHKTAGAREIFDFPQVIITTPLLARHRHYHILGFQAEGRISDPGLQLYASFHWVYKEYQAKQRNSVPIKNPTRCNSVSKFYFIFMWRSTCFGRHTAHHQEPITVLTASGFAYVEGCWTCSCWTLSGSCPTASTNYKAINPPRMQNQRLLVQL
jgi:hypothetical protein